MLLRFPFYKTFSLSSPLLSKLSNGTFPSSPAASAGKRCMKSGKHAALFRKSGRTFFVGHGAFYQKNNYFCNHLNNKQKQIEHYE